MNASTLFLVDGSGYLFRAFHAMPHLTSSAGEPTGAVYGVTNMLRRLLHEYQPQQVAVIFDAKGKNFRHTLYPAYKATRPPMPAELAAQIAVIHEIVDAMGLPRLIIDGVEADDVIATLTRQALESGMAVKIFSGDKDLAQLVQDRVTLINTMNDTCLDEAGVFEKFAVKPSQIGDYLALMGDSVDNVPGVAKVGPKTAAKWLAEYGSLDALLTHAAEISGKVGENLRAAIETLPLSKTLVSLKDDVDLPYTPANLHRRDPDHAKLNDLYIRLDFKSWLAESQAAPLPAPTKADYHCILSVAELDTWLTRLKENGIFAFDTETTSLDYMQARLVGFSVAMHPGEAAYVPLAHEGLDAAAQLPLAATLEALKPLLEDENLKKIGQHLKYDAHILRHYGIELRGIAFDTMLESYVLDSTASRHNLDDLARHYLNYQTTTYEDVAGKGKKQLCFNQVPLTQASHYAAEDADITLRLHHYLWPRLQAQTGLQRVFNEIEMALVPVLVEMEHIGVKIDATVLHAHSKELALKLHELEQTAYVVAGQPFNLGSPKQLQEILFDKLAIPVKSKTPKGQPSTAEAVLQELAEEYELPRVIMEHRSLSKLKSTYTDRLPQQINPASGRVHTSYHQAVAQTGRLSSAEPNLQNIPVRTPEGRRIRQAFIAPPDTRLLAADYSQIELRIMAHLSADPTLLNAFAAGEDIHRATAAEVFNTPLAEVSGEQRRSAKAINFGLIYGMSAFGLAKQLNITRTMAQDYIDQYFARYPGVKDYMEQTRAQAVAQGYVETVFGRRLYLADINARNAQRRQYAERTAINAPMQGTAADIIKLAMIRIHAWIQSSGAPVKMIMQVHDELVFEVATSEVDNARAMIVAHMRAAANLRVPLEVDTGVGANWDEAH
jgi:DNA polymerase I